MSIRSILACASIALAPVLAHAELRVGAKLMPSVVTTGSPAKFQVFVQGEGRHGKPTVTVDESVRVIDRGTSQQLSLGGGRSSLVYTYNFDLVPSKLGNFEVEAEIPIEGDALLTDPETLNVRDRTAAERERERQLAAQLLSFLV